jgi:hypothetical protein
MSRSVTVLALAIAVPSAALAQTGSVRGTIRFETGVPLANTTVWLSGQTFRSTRSDSLGRFHLDSLSPGTHTIEALCPSQQLFSFAVPVALRRDIDVPATGASDLNATVARAACEPIPARAAHVHWRGWYSAGFENSAFRPCSADSLAREVLAYGHPFGRLAWVDWPPTAWRAPGVGRLAPDRQTGGESGFVEWSGTLRGPAPAGHLGVANYSLTIDSVFSVAPTGRC